jgi:DNA-directed RNA polymerase specialized sigma24 family protein
MFTEQQLILVIPSLKKYAKKLDYKNYEDLVQDTLEKAWGNRDKYDNTKGSLKSWMLSAMHNIYYTSLFERGFRRGQVPKILTVSIDRIKYEKRINPNQEHIISLNELEKLPNYYLAFYKALGYSLEEIMELLKKQDIDIKRTWLYTTIDKFKEYKEEYL